MNRNILIALLTAAPLAAQTRLAGPVSGVVFDAKAKSLRPMLGVPGASYLGNAVATGLDIAAVSPDGKLALGVGADGLSMIVLDGGFAAARQAIAKDLTSADLIAWSRDSKTAAIYSEAADSITFINENREVATARAEGTVTVLAVSGDEAAIAVGGELSVVSARGRRLVTRLGSISAIAIAGADLYLADREAEQVFAIRGYRDQGAPELLASAGRGVADPVALAVSANGKSLWIAGGMSKSLYRVDAAAGSVDATLPLDFEPSRLEAMGGMFLLNARFAAGDSFELLAGGDNPAVYFVPADAAVTTDQDAREE